MAKLTMNTAFRSNKDAALVYGEEGFAVIPLHWINSIGDCTCGRSNCSSAAKHPLTTHGLKDASKDLTQIENWWRKFPKANIGVVCGSVSDGLIVVDVDLAKGADPSALNLPPTLKAETGAGYHLWFKSGQTIRNSAGRLGPAIDVRGEGGYVVAPPSIHKSGKQYSFVNNDPIAELPESIISLLTQPIPVSAPKSADDEDPPIIVSYKAPDIPKTAPEGQRNAFLTRIGGRLRREGASVEEIEAFLLQANRDRCVPPLAEKEVRKIAHSLGRYTPAETLGAVGDPDPNQSQTNQAQGQSQPQTQQANQSATSYDPFAQSGGDDLLGAITAEELDLTIFSPPQMVLQGLFKGDWGIGVGIGSVGKTTFFHNVCICLAAGRPFPPVVPATMGPRRILYMDFESNPWRLQWQIRKLRQCLTVEENVLVDKNLHFAIEPEVQGKPWRMTDRESLINLAKYIQKHKIDLVIVDTYAQCADIRDENSNAEVQAKIVTPTRRLVKKFNCALLFLHHEGKNKKEDRESYMQYRVRGASALIDAARYSITMIPAEKQKQANGAKVVEIHNTKDKGEGFESVTMVLDQTTRWFSPIQVTAPPPKPKTVDELIIECLELAAQPLTRKEISNFLISIPDRTLYRKLSELTAAGEIIKKGKRYELADDEENAPETAPATGGAP